MRVTWRSANHHEREIIRYMYQQKYPEESFQKLFWDAQMKAATLNNSKNIKWDPLIICWCLYLHYLSSSANEMLRESDAITLPS